MVQPKSTLGAGAWPRAREPLGLELVGLRPWIYQMSMPPSQAPCYNPLINLLLDEKLLLTQEYKFSSYFKLDS
jgi:hypothetical protein